MHDILTMLDGDEQKNTSVRWKAKYGLLKRYVHAFKIDEKYDIVQIEKCLTDVQGTQGAQGGQGANAADHAIIPLNNLYDTHTHISIQFNHFRLVNYLFNIFACRFDQI